ncbi:hypothetical protein ACHQM5_001929 [Ranunculus cassubicifolius]
MKLRIRSLQTKETLKIETPNPSSLQILKDIIAPVNTQSESHQIDTSGVENSLKSSEISDELMDCDEELGEKGEALVKNLSTVPGFLQKVYKEEIGDASVESKYKLLIISVHG